MWGPQEEYAKLEPHDTKHENFLVLGPWRHGYWASSSRHLGNLDYGEPIGKEFRAQIEAKFFAHYLKDEPGFDLEDTASFQTGSNTWKYYSHFPPREAQPTSLHLVGDGQLSWSDAKEPMYRHAWRAGVRLGHREPRAPFLEAPPVVGVYWPSSVFSRPRIRSGPPDRASSGPTTPLARSDRALLWLPGGTSAITDCNRAARWLLLVVIP